MFKKILVGVDGSDHALRAVDIAASLAKAYDASVFLISVYRHHSPLESSLSMVRTSAKPETPDAALSAHAKESLEVAARRLAEDGLEAAERIVRRGPPARTIVDVARRRGVDAVVLGSRGLGDLEGFLLGSVSHKVASLAPCTVITVK